MWPQYTFLALLVFAAGINLAKHGDDHPDYNFWTWLIAAGIEMFVLYQGGFFSKLF